MPMSKHGTDTDYTASILASRRVKSSGSASRRWMKTQPSDFIPPQPSRVRPFPAWSLRMLRREKSLRFFSHRPRRSTERVAPGPDWRASRAVQPGRPGPQMAQMQFRAALDLPSLWAALTLTNSAPSDLEKLRPVFREQEHQRELLEKKTLSAGDLEGTPKNIPELIKPLKTTLGESLKPLLNPDQHKASVT